MDGDGLRIIREGHGLTQAQMAKELGVSRQSYIAWERDKYKMPADKVKILLDGSTTLAAAKPKETAKQQRDREAAEAEYIATQLQCYRSTRAFCRNHNEAMAIYKRNKSHAILPIAFPAILAEFPDILTDPDGNHAMSKNESFAAVGLTPNPEK